LPEAERSQTTVDEVQQAFLQNGIQSSDVGKMVLVDLQCGHDSFTVGKVIQVNSRTVELGVFNK
jgi:hypothetical protein